MDAGYCGTCGKRLSRYEEQRWQKEERQPSDANCFECEPEDFTLVPADDEQSAA